ncbi:DUF4087 domain-containing protein [Desulfonatronum thiodismutans]|uniref:DUF4087 domain-containing protein n=1 Tax=Desulfonatronum thiodismutans TaxID=159290 RepID=UPI0004ABE278|nr:DUF4087 domain-containing protein [Desulfonatronum thiodismutans]
MTKISIIVLIVLLFFPLVSASGQLQTNQVADRGWFANPTPGNIWFFGERGEWTISTQGGYQLDQEWDWPEFAPNQWVTTNVGNYGYGCLDMEFDANLQGEVTAITSLTPLYLEDCLSSPALRGIAEKLE